VPCGVCWRPQVATVQSLSGTHTHTHTPQVATVQSLSGTGSCRLMAEFQKRYMPGTKVYIPVPTWSNHHNIWKDAGVEQATHRYYNPKTRGLDLDGFLEDIHKADKGWVRGGFCGVR
jgi:aspartate/tyrosine/aromatic aminotransferase